MTEAQMKFIEGVADLSTEDKLNTILRYVMNLETIIAEHEEKVKALEHSSNIQDAIIELLVKETHWVNEQLGAGDKKLQITERINADILSTIETLEAKSMWSKNELLFYTKWHKKKYQRLKADGDIRTKFNGKAESVMRDDILDKSNLE